MKVKALHSMRKFLTVQGNCSGGGGFYLTIKGSIFLKACRHSPKVGLIKNLLWMGLF